MAWVRDTGFEEVLRRGGAAAAEVRPDVVAAGISLGVLCAQHTAQTRPGTRPRNT